MIDSYLRAANPEFRNSVGYDRRQKLRGWEDYQARFASCEFRHQNSRSIDLKAEKYDLAFIDATHEEEWVWHDFNKVRDHAKFVAFHDIVLPGGSTVYKFWEVAKTQYPFWEIVDRNSPITCGIRRLPGAAHAPASSAHRSSPDRAALPSLATARPCACLARLSIGTHGRVW